MSELPPRLRLPLLVLGMLSLVGGVLAGLARLALDVPELARAQAAGHGALMVAAFFGTVISLERAVALRRLWPYLAPLLSGLAGLLLLAGVPALVSGALASAAGGVLTLASLVVVRQQPAPFTATLAVGAACWSLGNLVWLLAAAVGPAVPLWIGFLVLTIAGERLELTRFLPPRPVARRAFAGLLVLAVLAACVGAAGDAAALRVFGGALFGIALWLLCYDIARQTVHQSGLTRFVAVCLLSGYVWLALAGLLGMAGALAAGHAWRDAALHAVLLGFVFSMVIGHAPIIFPAVMRVRIPYHPAFYLPLAVLHLSLLARVLADLAGMWAARQWAGVANALALLLFVLTLLAQVTAAVRVRAPGG